MMALICPLKALGEKLGTVVVFPCKLFYEMANLFADIEARNT